MQLTAAEATATVCYSFVQTKGKHDDQEVVPTNEPRKSICVQLYEVQTLDLQFHVNSLFNLYKCKHMIS